MLDKRDLEAIAQLFDGRFDQIDKRLDQMDGRLDQMEEMIEKAIDRSEEFLLDELDRYDKKYERQFDKINTRLDVLEQLYRPAKNEADTIEILLKTTADHDQRISHLEKMMA